MSQSAPKAGVSRRRVLRTFGVVGITGVAGCSRSQADPLSSTKGEDGSNSVFQSLSFELGDLVIGLPEDHDVSQISLIAPDGTAFASVAPDFGATTVRIPVADPKVGRADYIHYTPGVHELVAKVKEQTVRRSVPLEPSLNIVEVALYQGGDRPADAGNVTIRVRNSGNAPTWPYDATFVDAPNWAADNPLTEFVGLPTVEAHSGESVIIPPSGERTYTAATPPLLYDTQDSVECSGESIEFDVRVGVADGTVLSQRVRSVAAGERVYATIHEQYICSESSLEMIDE